MTSIPFTCLACINSIVAPIACSQTRLLQIHTGRLRTRINVPTPIKTGKVSTFFPEGTYLSFPCLAPRFAADFDTRLHRSLFECRAFLLTTGYGLVI